MPTVAAPAPSTRDRLSADLDAVFAKLPLWLRPDQVAVVLGNCTTEHVRQLRVKGAIEARDFRTPGARTGMYRYYKDSVRAYLASRPGPADLL